VNERRRDQRGIALSSPLALVAAGAVVVAGAAFVVTGGGNDGDHPDRATQAAAPTRSTPTASAAPTTAAPAPVTKKVTTTKQRKHKKKAKKAKKAVVRRGDTYVEVYNNSGISGLAGSTASRAQGAGWQVVGSDNWYGTIPASTVYYPPRLFAQARMLGKDLGISRLKPAIAPMRGDRLTVILTSDYS
jgi:pyruvate/2-oxoglutarate dehydrogenase complex dihydrolipoamide acyltransferase (E2) component